MENFEIPPINPMIPAIYTGLYSISRAGPQIKFAPNPAKPKIAAPVAEKIPANSKSKVIIVTQIVSGNSFLC